MKKTLYSMLTVGFSFLSSSLFAQSGVEAAPPDQGFWQTFVMIAIALGFFYVILWRPEQKRRKALEEQRSGLKKGDRVVAMGIIGNVAQVKEETAILRMYDGSKIEVFKAAITDILPDGGEDKGKKEESKQED